MNGRGLKAALPSVLIACALRTVASDSQPLVVADLGGASALPYYRALHLQPPAPKSTATIRHYPAPRTPATPVSEAAFLPVRSSRLTPGVVAPRVIAAPGLTPMFLIGDERRSRTWLVDHLSVLRTLRAVGLVVEVRDGVGLQSLRALAPGLTLTPVSADDLAERLRLTHYPVLITATAIEQ